MIIKLARHEWFSVAFNLRDYSTGRNLTLTICEATRIGAKITKITEHLSKKIKDEDGRKATQTTGY